MFLRISSLIPSPYPPPQGGREHLFLILVFTLLSCAPHQFYSGRRLPAHRVAIIQAGSASNKLGRVVIEKIDDFELKTKPSRVEVLPGYYTFEISYIYGDGVSSWTSQSNCKMKVVTEAGHVYQIEGTVDFQNKKWNGWLRDVKSGGKIDYCQ